MSYTIEQVGDYECILVREGDTVHQVPLDALGSWGVLLGIEDPGEILDAILGEARASVQGQRPQEDAWGEMFDALGEVTHTMAVSGVPVDFMEDLMDPGLGAPVPGAEALVRLQEARVRGRGRVIRGKGAAAPAPAVSGRRAARAAAPVDELAGLKAELRGARGEDMLRRRAGFIDEITPQIPLPPKPEPEPALDDKPFTLQLSTPLLSDILR